MKLADALLVIVGASFTLLIDAVTPWSTYLFVVESVTRTTKSCLEIDSKLMSAPALTLTQPVPASTWNRPSPSEAKL